MTPAPFDLSIYQGDSYDRLFRIRTLNSDNTLGPYLDLTGYVGASQIRATKAAATPLATFTVTIEDQTTLMGGVTISLSSSSTTGLPTTTTTPAVWDLQLTSTSGKIRTYVAGTVTVIGQVTR